MDLSALLSLAHETTYVECKGSGALSDRPFAAKVIRAALGMSNRRDGGFIIIGVETVDGRLVASGMNSADLRTWNHDDFADQLAKYADPYVSFSLNTKSNGNADFMVIEVNEFNEIPVLCKSQYDDPNKRVILRKGCLYVRSRGKPATTEVASQTEMREVLALATEKGLRSFLATAQRSGIRLDDLHIATAESMYSDQRGKWDE
jgi:predicted HTH transcriptional regulator